MEIEGMKESFFEWLNECPVQWFLTGDDDGSLSYSFTKDEESEEEN